MVQREQVCHSWLLSSKWAFKGSQVKCVFFMSFAWFTCCLYICFILNICFIVYICGLYNRFRPNQVAEKVAARISENFSEAAMIMVILLVAYYNHVQYTDSKTTVHCFSPLVGQQQIHYGVFCTCSLHLWSPWQQVEVQGAKHVSTVYFETD